jgi:cytochrome c-type biogenesis protein CcmH/NrfF
LKLLRHRLRSTLHLIVVATVVAFGAHAAETANSARFDKLGHRLMCTCGCNQLLGECDHVGCPDREKMNTQLIASINHGDSDDQIFHAFQDEYGPTALAAPMFTRLNRFSWWVPPIVLLLGIGGVFFVVRRWRPRTVPMPTPATDPHTLVLEQRIRQETGGDSL